MKLSTNIWRLVTGTLVVAAVVSAGGVAVWLVGDGKWTLPEALYMALISAATVGFSELPGLEQVPWARPIVVLIILVGIGAITYLQSSLTAFFVEGTIAEAFRRRRMDRQIAGVSDHVVVAGVGSTGTHVIEELIATRTPFVAIDRSREHLEQVNQTLADGKMLYVVGEATEDHTLDAAGTTRAKAVIAALTDDRDNLYVTLSARSMNTAARIIAKVISPEAAAKMLRAGANGTVSPNTIGGRRLASEAIRPNVVAFLDQMLRDREAGLRFEEVTIPEGSRYVGKPISQGPFKHDTNTLVVAARESANQPIRYNPNENLVMQPGLIVVVMGEAADVGKLRAILSSGA